MREKKTNLEANETLTRSAMKEILRELKMFKPIRWGDNPAAENAVAKISVTILIVSGSAMIIGALL
jgi:hypothetical protein